MLQYPPTKMSDQYGAWVSLWKAHTFNAMIEHSRYLNAIPHIHELMEMETMPKKLHRAVNKIKKKGHSESSAYAIATAALKKKKKGKKS